jgi:hypothetical protein
MRLKGEKNVESAFDSANAVLSCFRVFLQLIGSVEINRRPCWTIDWPVVVRMMDTIIICWTSSQERSPRE